MGAWFLIRGLRGFRNYVDVSGSVFVRCGSWAVNVHVILRLGFMILGRARDWWHASLVPDDSAPWTVDKTHG